MGFTIQYKGTLAKTKSPSDVFEVISKIAEENNWTSGREDDVLFVDFPESISETLTFDLSTCSMDGICKFLFEEPQEFIALFNLFAAIMPLFSEYEISDDYDAWPEFLAEIHSVGMPELE